MMFHQILNGVFMVVTFGGKMCADTILTETVHMEEKHQRNMLFQSVYCLMYGWMKNIKNVPNAKRHVRRRKMDRMTHNNDGWIPVEKEWPPFGQRLQATILHHEWIADYDSYWVPEEEKTYHPAYMEVCEIYPMGEMWCYSCEEDKYEKDIAYINPAKVLSRPVAEIIAWRPLPEPYRKG